MTQGLKALLENRAWVDISARGRIRVTGEDRARLIHALSTNHIQGMTPGSELYAFFLNAQGRILGDAYITCYEDHLLLDVEPQTREPLLRHIEHYIIADDVTVEDVTADTFALLAAGKRVYGNSALKEWLIPGLTVALTEATAEDAENFRILNFHPRYGIDFGLSTLPQETGLTRALHFNKGCYLGQEIVERIRSRGHVNKMLAELKIDAQYVPHGADVHLEGEEIGQVKSSANVPPVGSRAIAMVKIAGAKPGTAVRAGGITAEVCAVS